MLNLVQLQERLKDVPMQALMQYANGSNPQVPPFLALGELNRRKKMQEGAAAEQAKEMEGAPTIKQQIEQAAGLMALQGNRQQQAAQQQQGAQANMPMAAPNTTTSEPAQMASGGFIDDVVVPRDYQMGGRVGPQMTPEMLKKLMMLKAMKQRQSLQSDYAPGGQVFDPEKLKQEMLSETMRGDVADIPKELTAAVRRAALRGAPGISSLSLPKNMFKRKNYAGGGIVAFAGPEGSYVERSPGFYQLAEEVPSEEKPEDVQSLFRELLRRQRERRPTADLLREAKLDRPPQVASEELAELQRSLAEQKAQAPMDQLMTFLSGITEGRGGNWATQGARGAKAAMALEAQQRAGMNAMNQQMAKIKDLRTKAEYDAARGNIKDAQTERDAADKLELDILSKMSESEYKSALRQQALAGRTAEGDRAAQIYLESRRAQGDTRPDAVILDEGRVRDIRERGAAFVRGQTGEFQAGFTVADKARDNVDNRLKDFKSKEFRELNRLMAEDRKNAAAGKPTNLADSYKQRLYSEEEGALRGRSSPQPSQAPRGSAPPPPPGFVPQK